MEGLTPELLLNGVLALLIIKEVLNFVITFVKKKSESGEAKSILSAIDRMEKNYDKGLNSICDKCTLNSKYISDMYKWHEVKDEDGVFLWYIRKSLSSAFDNLAKSLYNQNDVLRQLLQDNKDILRENSELRKLLESNQNTTIANQYLIKETRELIKETRELIKDVYDKK